MCYDATHRPLGNVAIGATIDGNDGLYQLLKKKARSGIKHLLPLSKEL